MRSRLPLLLVSSLILSKNQAAFAAVPEAAKDGFFKTSDGVRPH